MSRGKITKEQLRDALAMQELGGKNLGTILREMGLLSREEVESHVAAKAEENIYGLFDWTDAVFRFHEKAADDPFLIEVDLAVQDVVLKGIQRFDDLARIRDTFTSSGIVLRRTEQTIPPEVTASPMARRVLSSVDGRRTLAEILLHAHASEFLVLKFLYTLLRKGIVSIIEVRQPDRNSRTLLDPIETPKATTTIEPPGSEDRDMPTESTQPKSDRRDVETALQAMARGEYARALDILNACYIVQPDDNQLRRLLLEAEAGYLEKVRRDMLVYSKVPVRVAPAERAEQVLKPTELFLMSMLDGRADIKSIVWLAPLREVDVIRALHRMLDGEVIELREAPAEPASGKPSSSTDVQPLQWSGI
jgi:hypothetical protein